MPWTERTKVMERVKFIARLNEGEKMSDLCREFGISRKTGYKFVQRFEKYGPEGLTDQRRRPYACPHRTRENVVDLIIEIKKSKPHWGSPKIRSIFQKKYPHLKVPARSTVHSILDKAGYVAQTSKRSRSIYAKPTKLQPGLAPNELWCIDFKGQFQMANNRYCYPLTVSDFDSRYLLGIEALESTKADPAFCIFEEIFDQYGLPDRIRSDNGAPFASSGLHGLTRLSVWFLRLGILLERIEPGNPQQNGRHERIHRTLNEQLVRESNLLKQQEHFDHFRKEYNEERPHSALSMRTPSEIYRMSKRPMPLKLNELSYNNHDLTKRVTVNGHVNLIKTRKKEVSFYLGIALGGENIGIKQVEDNLYRIDFMDYELGYFDQANQKFLPTE